MKQMYVAMALAAAVAALPGMAFEFVWEDRDGGAVITGCSGEVSGALEIPETLGGLPVRGIEYGAFWGQAGLTSVSVSTNVTWIGMHAFAGTKMFDNVTDAAQVPVYSTDGKWLLGCRLCYFTYTRHGETRKMHKPVSVKVKEGVEHLADGAFVGAEHPLQDGYTQLAAIDSISLPVSLKTVGSAICNHDHLGLKVDFPTNVVEVADDFHACAAGVQFRFLGRCPEVVEGAGWLEAVDAEGFSPAPTAIYFRNGAEGWDDGDIFAGNTLTWSRGCVEEDATKIRMGNVHCFGKYSDDVFLERESRAYPREWVAIPVTGATKAAQVKPLLVPCGDADASLVGAPAVWTDAKMFDTVVKPGLKKKWAAERWSDIGYGEVAYPGYWEYSDAKKDIDYRFPEDLWPNKKAVANRFWIVAKVNSSKAACFGPQIFRIGLSGTVVYSDPFIANCQEASPVDASDALRGLTLSFSGTLSRNGQHFGSPGTVYDGAPHYSIDGKAPLTIKVSLPGPGTLVVAGGEDDCLEKDELKISGAGIVQDLFSEEFSSVDEYAYLYGSSPYRRRVKVSGATTLTLKLPDSDWFEFTRMHFFPSDAQSVAIDAGCYTPYTEAGVATRSAFARGYVKGTGVYRAGETVTLVAVAGEGEAFDSWECLYGTLPDEVDLSSPTLSFEVPADACGTADEERQIFVRAVWKSKASETALPIPVGTAVAGKGEWGVELTRTGKYRFVEDPDATTYRPEFWNSDIDQEHVSYVRLELRPPAEDWLELAINDTDLHINIGQSLADVATEYVRVSSGSEATVAVSGLPKGALFDAKTGTLKGVFTKSGVHYITFTAKNANGYLDARVLRLVVGDATDTFQNGAKVYADSYSTSTPFDLPDLVVGEPIGTKTFYVQNYSLTKLKVAGLPPGLKVKVKNGYGGGCSFCGGTGSVTFSGTPSKVGPYTIVISGKYKGKTYKTVRTVVVQGKQPSLYFPVSLAADSTGRGTVSGGGVKAFGSTVKLTAKSANAKKYFFGGWYVGENLDERLDDYISCNSRATTVSFAVAAKRVVEDDYWEGETVSFEYYPIRNLSQYGIYARFVTKEEDSISINANTEWRVSTSNPLTVNVQSFSSYTLSVNKTAITTASKKAKAAVSVSGNTLKVTNASALKPGYHRLVLTAKNAAGNTCSFVVTAFVPNLTGAVYDGLIDLDTSDEGYTLQAGKAVTLDDLGIQRGKYAKIIAVSGLPAGLKWDAKKQRFTGVPTKVGTYTVVFTVKYTGSSWYTYTSRASATFNVKPLPDCAVGTFRGYTTVDGKLCATSRSVSVSTTSGGGITLKIGTLTFTKTGWTMVNTDETGWTFTTLTATRTVGKGKSAKTYTDVLNVETCGGNSWTEDGMYGTITTYLNGDVVNRDDEFTARKSVFGSNADAQAMAASVVAAGTAKFGLKAATEGDHAYDLTLDGSALSVTANADGAVTLAGKIDGVKVSGTTTLAPHSPEEASAVFFSGNSIIEVVYTFEDGAVGGVSGRVWKK